MGRVPADLNPSDGELVVAEVFGPTFQGEGPSIGRRAGFVRLGRCNLDCAWCDTPYTWDWDRFDPADELRRSPIAAVLAELDAMTPEIVVITGGEPLLQQRHLGPLLEGCAARGWPVEIETNGTIVPDPAVTALVHQWNVSPKLANSGIDLARRIRPDALEALVGTGRAVFKFVVAEPGRARRGRRSRSRPRPGPDLGHARRHRSGRPCSKGRATSPNQCSTAAGTSHPASTCSSGATSAAAEGDRP